MSGTFNPDHNTRIEATDNPELAKAHGLTQFDKATGQWRAPQPPDAGQRDGADVQERRRLDALDEGNAQHEAEHGHAPGEHGSSNADANADGKAPGKSAPTKATGSKASQSKDDDKK